MTRAEKIAAQTSQIIRIRDLGHTYLATGGGKRTTCTQGPANAAYAHASKLFGDRPFNLNPLREYNTWRATACKES